MYALFHTQEIEIQAKKTKKNKRGRQEVQPLLKRLCIFIMSSGSGLFGIVSLSLYFLLSRLATAHNELLNNIINSLATKNRRQ